MFRGDRMCALMEAQRISQSELARQIGVSTTAIWKMMHSRVKNPRELHRVARVLSTSADYLLGHIDEPTGLSNNVGLEGYDGIDINARVDLVSIYSIDKYLTEKFYDRDAQDSQKSIVLSNGLLRIFTKSPVNMIFHIDHVGDAMDPTIRRDDYVLIDTSQTKVRRGGMIWACCSAGTTFLCRLRLMPEGQIQLSVDNRNIDDEVVLRKHVTIIGRVIGHFGKL